MLKDIGLFDAIEIQKNDVNAIAELLKSLAFCTVNQSAVMISEVTKHNLSNEAVVHMLSILSHHFILYFFETESVAT